jgi:CRP-like cAMP-binding protein
MANESKTGFDVDAYLRNSGHGRKIVQLNSSQVFFSQGDPADCVFYLHKGRVKISVLSSSGREATIRLVSASNFFGEKAMAVEPGLRVTTATAVTASSFLLDCNLRTQADLVDQLFNRAEKRLARILLLLAEYSQPGEENALIQPISQEALANMIGSTRPRVNAFLSRFRKLGFIEYNSRIRVHKSLLSVFLRD